MQTSLLVSGTAHRALAARVGQLTGLGLAELLVERFPDGEIQVELRAEVRGANVFIVQALRPPAGEHLLELLLIADACRREGAQRVTAVVPYLGYSRQDRRQRVGEPLGARVIAEVLDLRLDALIAVDLHSRAVEGCFGSPIEHLTAVPLLARQYREGERPEVVVSPDLGAVRLAERYARELGIPVAIVHKHRLSGSEVAAAGIVGDVAGLAPLIVDDVISTGGTIAAAAEALLAAGCTPRISIAATHGLFTPPAAERLVRLPIHRLVTTDSVPPPADLRLDVETVTIAELLGAAISA